MQTQTKGGGRSILFRRAVASNPLKVGNARDSEGALIGDQEDLGLAGQAVDHCQVRLWRRGEKIASFGLQ